MPSPAHTESCKGWTQSQVDWLRLTHKEPEPSLLLGVFLSPSPLYLTVRRQFVVFPLYSLPAGIALLFASIHFLLSLFQSLGDHWPGALYEPIDSPPF
jgi:hypothetical protein